MQKTWTNSNDRPCRLRGLIKRARVLILCKQTLTLKYNIYSIYSYKSICFWIERHHLSSSRKFCEIKALDAWNKKLMRPSPESDADSYLWRGGCWCFQSCTTIRDHHKLCASDCLWFNLNRGVRWAGLLHIQPPPHPTPPQTLPLPLSHTHTTNDEWIIQQPVTYVSSQLISIQPK